MSLAGATIEGEEFFQRPWVSKAGYLPLAGVFVGVARTVYGIGMGIFHGVKALGTKIKSFFTGEEKKAEVQEATHEECAKAARAAGHILRGLAEIPSIFGFPLFVHDMKHFDTILLCPLH